MKNLLNITGIAAGFLLIISSVTAQTTTTPTTTTTTNPASSTAQTAPLDTANTRNYYLILRDGTSIRGRIVRRDSIVLTVRRDNGQLTYVEPELLERIVTTAPPATPAPATGPVQQLTLRDGSTVTGRIRTRTDSLYTVEKSDGEVTYVEASLISQVAPLPEKPTEPGLFTSFLLQRSSVINPRQGSVYYRNSWLIQNELVYGVADFLSLGLTYTPTRWFLQPQGYVQSLRYSAQAGLPIGPWFRLAASVGFMPYQNYDFGRYLNTWDYQVMAGFGNPSHMVTLAYGWQTNGYPTQRRYVRIGANLQLAKHVAFVMDNTLYIGAPPTTYVFYYGFDDYILYDPNISLAYTPNRPLARTSLAMRFGNARQTVDVGLMAALSPSGNSFSDFIDARPYLGYSRHFGR